MDAFSLKAARLANPAAGRCGRECWAAGRTESDGKLPVKISSRRFTLGAVRAQPVALLLLTTLLAILAASAAAFAQPAGTLAGSLFDQTGGALANVAVDVRGPVVLERQSDATGRFEFRDLPPGARRWSGRPPAEAEAHRAHAKNGYLELPSECAGVHRLSPHQLHQVLGIARTVDVDL